MINNQTLSNILSHFKIDANAIPFGNGHINDTYIVGTTERYILQKINTFVFHNPDDLMQNIQAVTSHIGQKLRKRGEDTARGTLRIIPTDDNKLYYKTTDNNCYRLYAFIPNSKTVELVETPDQIYQLGKAFGTFQNDLADFPAQNLKETIRDFHNTPKRADDLEKAIKSDTQNRAKNALYEIEFARSIGEKYKSVLYTPLINGEIPTRVTHNDTKINNVLFDAETGKSLCVIDLDTIMPGSMLYDYGDALRTGAATASEDETNLSKMEFNLTLFEAFSKGFLEELMPTITPSEFALLPVSPLVLTLECGIRFLEDYLKGDVYFKTSRPHHNLDRARTQFKLVQDMEQKLDTITEVLEGFAYL